MAPVLRMAENKAGQDSSGPSSDQKQQRIDAAVGISEDPASHVDSVELIGLIAIRIRKYRHQDYDDMIRSPTYDKSQDDEQNHQERLIPLLARAGHESVQDFAVAYYDDR